MGQAGKSGQLRTEQELRMVQFSINVAKQGRVPPPLPLGTPVFPSPISAEFSYQLPEDTSRFHTVNILHFYLAKASYTSLQALPPSSSRAASLLPLPLITQQEMKNHLSCAGYWDAPGVFIPSPLSGECRSLHTRVTQQLLYKR